MSQPPTFRILVLDDDPIFLEVTTAFLSMAGHVITAVSSSDQALAQLRTDSTFDLVLTDLNMPGLEGHALASALRAAVPARTSLVGMSASAPSPATSALFDAFLPKPFNPQSLHETIQAAIRSRASSNLGTPAGSEPQESSQPVLDETTFQTLARAIPHAKLRQLYDLGIADVEKRLARMEGAVASGDLATVRREAHAIKGSCGMVGALELQTLAAALEESTTFEASAMARIGPACLRLRRMLDSKFESI